MTRCRDREEPTDMARFESMAVDPLEHNTNRAVESRAAREPDGDRLSAGTPSSS